MWDFFLGVLVCGVFFLLLLVFVGFWIAVFHGVWNFFDNLNKAVKNLAEMDSKQSLPEPGDVKPG